MVFYMAPLVVVAVLVYRQTVLTRDAIAVLITALSVIGGLLFNLLVLLHTLTWKEEREPLATKLTKFLKQLHSNIAYAIVVALVAMIPLVVGANYSVDAAHPAPILMLVCGYLSMYLAIHFALTMTMVLRRMHVALKFRLS